MSKFLNSLEKSQDQIKYIEVNTRGHAKLNCGCVKEQEELRLIILDGFGE